MAKTTPTKYRQKSFIHNTLRHWDPRTPETQGHWVSRTWLRNARMLENGGGNVEHKSIKIKSNGQEAE